ncbi:reverse transcriptase domain-containing protein [Tanacetum coccineum]
MIGSTLTEEGHNKLCGLLQRNLDIFAWKPADMTGVPRHIVEHLLNVREGCSPVRQKKRGQAADRNQAIQEEVGKLVEAGIMKKRMCVDFKDLNKACPKDGYPLPKIDWKVESLCRFPFKFFLDAYKGYHQIQMAKEDEEKTAFITSQVIFCYTKMPFGLRNAGATYQRLVDKAFHKQIVYIWGRRRNVPRIQSQHQGDEVCLDKVDAVLSLPSPKCLKDVQKLNEKLASLNRFLAKAAEKSLPFFKTLKKCTNKSDFHWTTEAEEAFKQMKQLIAELPMLTAPMEKEELIVYRIERPEEDSPDTLMEMEEELPEPWILFTDGSSCTDGSGAGLILTNPEGMEFTYALRFRFDAINNEAEYEALIAGLRIAEQIVKVLTGSFKAFTIKQIPRSENKRADALSKIASKSFVYISKQVLVEEIKEKSISEVEVLTVVEEEGDTWMTPIFKYLAEETLPADIKKARGNERRGGPLQANYVLREIHEGSCSMHAGIRSVVGKALRTGYYWPTMHKDARTLIRACQDYQVHKPVPRNLQQKLTPITSPWPFYKWGIDIARPFLEGPGKFKFLIVAMDYFTKWIEAKLVATITGNQIKKFTNELVERANRSLGEGIKASNRDTPFSLTYGMEAVISAKIGMATLRTAELDLVWNNEALKINLDLLEERREEAAIREAKRDLVYRKNNASRAEDTEKLGPKWEGPYEVTEALGKGAYRLKDRDGKQLPRTWCNTPEISTTQRNGNIGVLLQGTKHKSQKTTSKETF